MSETKLKPCPFCGNNDRRVGIRRMGNKGYKIICGKCGAGGSYVAIKDWHDNKMIAQGQAIEAWNTRKPVDDVLERLEAIRQEYLKEYKIYLDGEDYRSSLLLDNAIEIIKEVLGYD